MPAIEEVFPKDKMGLSISCRDRPYGKIKVKPGESYRKRKF